MFFKVFKTRFLCILRSPELIFWALAFPIILGTLFHFAFAGFDDDYSFSPVPVAVVENEKFKADTYFKEAIKSVSGDDKDTTQLFKVTYCTKEKADTLLENSEIKGYFDYNTKPEFIVHQSGTAQSIAKSFLDSYLQQYDAITTIIKENPAAAQSIISEKFDPDDYIKEVSQTSAKPDLTLNYYFALIAMACLFGGTFGLNEVSVIQANQSTLAARMSIAPVKKTTVFLGSSVACTLIMFISNLILLAFLTFILKVDMGTRIPQILLGCLMSSFTGISMGYFIGVVIKANARVKDALLITVSLTLCFLAGLMVVEMKHIVAVNVPLLAALNPANAITDTFYSLYYCDTLGRYIKDMLTLGGMSAFFYICVYFVMRRQRYESI